VFVSVGIIVSVLAGVAELFVFSTGGVWWESVGCLPIAGELLTDWHPETTNPKVTSPMRTALKNRKDIKAILRKVVVSPEKFNRTYLNPQIN